MNKVLGIAGLIFTVIFIAVIVLHGNARYAEGKKACQLVEAKAVIEVKTKNAKIRNNRPGTDALIKRLRSHTY